jgi:hypothetical protein
MKSEITLLQEKLARSEAKTIAVITVCAALLKHHPFAPEVKETLRLLVDLNATTLLGKSYPDELAENIAKTVDRVIRLSDVQF